MTDERMMERGAGILLPIFSLPSNYGIGTFGKAAYDFIDFLVEAGQRYWQILPLNPTGYGDSPYNSFSAFAGNPYFIDLDILISEGLLTNAEVDSIDFGTDPRHVDYGKLYENRVQVLKLAKMRDTDTFAFSEFKKKTHWLEEYCLFMALKRHFGMASWLEWSDCGVRRHEEGRINHYRKMLSEDMEIYAYVQYLFFKQWKNLKAYANSRGIRIIGDIPLYVALDSVDCWSRRQEFLMDANGKPEMVAGVPPDNFSDTGQLWGNPLYNWQRMKKNDYEWWKKRLKNAEDAYDIIRFDHFRGLESFWAIPYGMKDGMTGEWIKGPDKDFFDSVKREFPNICGIAENLGYITSEVDELLEYSGFYGMNVFQFAFTSDETNSYLPGNQKVNSVCYTGTHDNPSLSDWRNTLSDMEKSNLKKLFKNAKTIDYDIEIIIAGLKCPAQVFMAQMQDYLRLDKDSRINYPGKNDGNWSWRMLEQEMSHGIARKIRKLAEATGRI